MLKIFQTGDNHIGLKYASHEKAEALVSARISAFEQMVALANEEGCDLFVITGDLFENTYGIANRDVKSLVELLSAFRGTVVILPGNHDFYDKDLKLWQTFRQATADKDNILLLTDDRPYALTINEEKVLLYPALCRALHSEPGQNNLGWIKAEQIIPDGTYRIGIAHGAVAGETIDKEGQYYLMTRQELESIPVDVWLLGHTHVPFPADLGEEFQPCEKILNAGTHVQTDVSCNTEGLCFIIEMDEQKNLRAKKVLSGNLHFYRKNIALRASEMQATLERELAPLPDNSVVDLVLSGAVSGEEYDNRCALIEGSLSRFVEGTYNDSALSRLLSKEQIDAEFAETSFSGKLLTALLDEPKEAQLAYELLKSLKEGR